MAEGSSASSRARVILARRCGTPILPRGPGSALEAALVRAHDPTPAAAQSTTCSRVDRPGGRERVVVEEEHQREHDDHRGIREPWARGPLGCPARRTPGTHLEEAVRTSPVLAWGGSPLVHSSWLPGTQNTRSYGMGVCHGLQYEAEVLDSVSPRSPPRMSQSLRR